MEGLYLRYDSQNNKIFLHFNGNVRALDENEIDSLITSVSDYLAVENLPHAISHLNATMGSQSSVIFDYTKKIHTVDNHSYGISLGLYVENSQTVYNLHKGRGKCNS